MNYTQNIALLRNTEAFFVFYPQVRNGAFAFCFALNYRVNSLKYNAQKQT